MIWLIRLCIWLFPPPDCCCCWVIVVVRRTGVLLLPSLQIFLDEIGSNIVRYSGASGFVIDVELTDAPASEVSVEMVGDGLEMPDVPNEKNLAVCAARALQRACGVARGVRIRIVKRIPAGAGLGGGSADAAAVLNGLNEMWGLGMPKEKLCAIGAEVGSDVPALVLGGVVLMEGRGERVRALDAGERRAR